MIKTILWADDDSDDLMMMKEILMKNSRNYQIMEVHNGKEALDYLQKSKENSSLPCLMILDMNMPILVRKQTLSILKKTDGYSEIPVVVFTTSSSELDKLFCRRLNVEMITKPPHYKSLEDAVLRLLQFCSR